MGFHRELFLDHYFSRALSKVGYHNLNSFTHLGHVCGSGSLLVVHPSTPFRSVQEVINLSRKEKDKWSYGTSGVGGPHLSGEYFCDTEIMSPAKTIER